MSAHPFGRQPGGEPRSIERELLLTIALMVVATAMIVAIAPYLPRACMPGPALPAMVGGGGDR